jgi:hypothetical protein
MTITFSATLPASRLEVFVSGNSEAWCFEPGRDGFLACHSRLRDLMLASWLLPQRAGFAAVAAVWGKRFRPSTLGCRGHWPVRNFRSHVKYLAGSDKYS